MAFTKVRDCAAIHCHDGTVATILVSLHRLQSASLNMHALPALIGSILSICAHT